MDDDDYEDENWGNLEGEVITVELEQNNYGLGLSLAGAITLKVPDFLVFYISQSLSQIFFGCSSSFCVCFNLKSQL